LFQRFQQRPAARIANLTPLVGRTSDKNFDKQLENFENKTMLRKPWLGFAIQPRIFAMVSRTPIN